MSAPENQLLLLRDPKGGEDRPVFLVLTAEAGSDFTFYLRDDREADRVRRILQQQSGQPGGAKAWAAGAGPGESVKREPSFSCRISTLHPLLNKDDFKRDADAGDAPVLLRELRRAKDEAAGLPRYVELRGRLNPVTRDALDEGEAGDEEKLLKAVFGELNGLLAGGGLRVFSGDPMTGEDESLLDQVGEPGAKSRLGNYLRFCSLFRDAIVPLESRLKTGRVLASLCYEGRFWSVSFRKQESGTGYAPSAKIDGTLNSIEEICHALYEEIFYAVGHSEDVAGRNEPDARPGGPEPGEAEGASPAQPPYRKQIDDHRKAELPELSGLVVIAGSTNSAKSLVTRGLIHLYLESVLRRGARARRPHLVTFEDPIEKYLADEAPTSAGDPAHPAGGPDSLGRKVDYTPRQQKTDVGRLQGALRDALRQTPKVFFVGETRKRQDWRALIDFAGTGHLVVTTAHAGSLIEAMHKIFLATEARTPADRNEVASRLLAVVQLKRTELTGDEGVGALVPALWRRVPRGLNSLTAEGLASILPHSDSGEENPCSCLGRKYFVGRLLDLADERRPHSPNVKDDLITRAIDWDLQGA